MKSKKLVTRFINLLVKARKLTPIERLANRVGYMGTAFINLIIGYGIVFYKLI